MKQLLVIIFTSSYFLSVTGLNFNYHFCGNELESISLTVFADEDNCCGGGEMEDGCCQNEQYELKVKNEQKCNFTLALQDFDIAFLTNLPVYSLVSYVTADQNDIVNYHPPPPKPNNSLLDLNCVLRI